MDNCVEVKIKKLREDAIVPKRATCGSAGFDLYACLEECMTLDPGEIVKIPTGISLQLSDNYVALIFARSGLGVNNGISLANGVGVVDSDYRGEIFVGLINLGKEKYVLEPNQRIAQVIIMSAPFCKFQQVENLDDTQRGMRGFGSTGK